MVSQSDAWTKEYNEALKLADDISTMVSSASLFSSIGPQTQRHFANTRRKIIILRTKLQTLELLSAQLPAATRQPITEREMNKRKEMLANVGSKVDQLANTLNSYSTARRDRLLGQDTRSDSMINKAADMDNHGVVAFQRRIMEVQDEEIGKLEEGAVSIKHIALTINGELDLQNRLLVSLDDHVESTESRLQRLQRKLAIFSKNTKGGCSCLCLTVLSVVLILIIVALVVVTCRLQKYHSFYFSAIGKNL